MRTRTKTMGLIACLVCFAAVIAPTTASSQQQKKQPPRLASSVTGLVVMTPNGPATCSTWIQWRLPGASPVDKAAVEYWAEGYLSGLAAGSRHDVIGKFRTKDLGTWLTTYCTANPGTKLQDAIQALGLAMLAHPEGKL